MKAIELTEEHKTILLEMCKTLFPETKNWNIELEPEYDGSEYFIFPFAIHWFEFCSLHLLEKLYRDTKDLNNFLSICFRYKFPEWDPIHRAIHPVNYLYEEFLKLK